MADTLLNLKLNAKENIETSLFVQVPFPGANGAQVKGEIFQLQWRRLQVLSLEMIEELWQLCEIRFHNSLFFSVKDMDGRLWFRCRLFDTSSLLCKSLLEKYALKANTI